MKTTLAIIILGLSITAHAQYETNFVAIPDKTPGITNTASAWGLPESPGTYFWNGFRVALVIGFFGAAVGAGVKYWARRD